MVQKIKPKTLRDQIKIWLLQLFLGEDGVNILLVQRSAADIAVYRAAYAKYSAAEQEFKAAQARLKLAGNELVVCLGGAGLQSYQFDPVPATDAQQFGF